MRLKRNGPVGCTVSSPMVLPTHQTKSSLLVAVGQLSQWPPRRWMTAAAASVVVALAVGLPTDVIPNPIFGRPVPVTWWSYPVLVVTAVLGGLLVATYVRVPELDAESERTARAGGFAGLLSVFAVGCPVCNHLVVLAIGVTGARQWFEPFQPVLAVASLGLLGYALLARLRWAEQCPIPVGAERG